MIGKRKGEKEKEERVQGKGVQGWIGLVTQVMPRRPFRSVLMTMITFQLFHPWMNTCYMIGTCFI